jgi:phosphatidylinositol alpha-mannosyltransferase
VGQAVERKGLPMLVSAFEALREHIPAELTVIGPSEEELAPLLLDPRGVRALGKADDQVKRRELCAADVFVAPSLGGESFGMVLTEAFAAGATVVASDIAGYRDVVSAGSDGLLVPPGDAQALAEVMRELYHEPQRRLQLAQRAAQTVERFAWGQVAGEVMRAYEDAIAVPDPVGVRRKLAVWTGFAPADLGPRVPAQRLESIEPRVAPGGRQRGRWARARRWVALGAGLTTAALAYLGLRRIGIAGVGQTLVNSEPTYVLLGLAAMAVAMVLRGLAWHAAVRAALPSARVSLPDTLRATMIGVLMSATLPARLGEPSRALILARRTGRPRDTLPVLLGTVVSQTVINAAALILLGALTFSAAGFLAGRDDVLILTAGVPLLLLLGLVLVPLWLRPRNDSTRFVRLSRTLTQLQRATGRARGGLAVFRSPRLGAMAVAAQITAWAVQILACDLLLEALGLGQRVGLLAAAAVLFAVNVTAVLPATPANLGVFQFACATVLATGWHIGWGTGVAYGVILQAVELATAMLMGAPALLREGMSWREVRLRALHATPIKLPPRAPGRDGAYAAAPAGSSNWRG